MKVVETVRVTSALSWIMVCILAIALMEKCSYHERDQHGKGSGNHISGEKSKEKDEETQGRNIPQHQRRR